MNTSFHIMLVVGFIAIQVMAFFLNDPSMIWVSIAASTFMILYVFGQFMTANKYDVAAIKRLNNAGTAVGTAANSVRDPNNRFNTWLRDRAFPSVNARASSVLGAESRIGRTMRSMGLGSKIEQ